MNPKNHDAPLENAPLVNIFLDGQWVQAPKGMNVIEAAKLFGKEIPHYCYHPKLEIAGNCRMCLFEMGIPKLDAKKQIIIGNEGKPEIQWQPRPQIACATQIFEGMGIRTDSPLAQECRRSVLEFLLINHPLDCPICDQAGECQLQEFSSQYGQGESRFVEEKVKKSKRVDLGERIILDAERCILCSRCIRFAKEILHEDTLGFIKRGSHVEVSAHPCKKFDHPYSLNTVDICPVGALTSKDFRFQMRVWFLKDTKSICTGCATGCNILIGSREQKVYRLTPRENEEVNSHWMCDFGRLNIHDMDDPQRIREPLARENETLLSVAGNEIFRQIAQRMEGIRGNEIAVIASAKMTNEELFLLKQWTDAMDAAYVDIVPHTWEGDTFLKNADRNPNSVGARVVEISHEGKKLSLLRDAILKGEIKALFVFHEDAVEAGIDAMALDKLRILVAVSLVPNATTGKAHFVLPGCGFAEKSGTMINAKGRLQKLNRAVLPPWKEDWEIVRDLKMATTQGDSAPCAQKQTSPLENVFQEMASKHKEFSGLALNLIGSAGVQLSLNL